MQAPSSASVAGSKSQLGGTTAENSPVTASEAGLTTDEIVGLVAHTPLHAQSTLAGEGGGGLRGGLLSSVNNRSTSLHKTRGSESVRALDLTSLQAAAKSRRVSVQELREARWMHGGDGNWSARNHHSIYGIDEENLGRIHLALHRDQNTLRVAVLQCERLKRMDKVGQNDVYVEATVGTVIQRTPTVREGGAAPKWPGWDLDSLGTTFPQGDGHVMQFEGVDKAEVWPCPLMRFWCCQAVASWWPAPSDENLLQTVACLSFVIFCERGKGHSNSCACIGCTAQKLTIRCFDEDFGSSDDLIGATKIDLSIHPYVETRWMDVDWFMLQHEIDVRFKSFGLLVACYREVEPGKASNFTLCEQETPEHRWTIDPRKTWREVWDLVQAAVLFYVAIIVPYRIGFDIQLSCVLNLVPSPAGKCFQCLKWEEENRVHGGGARGI